MQQIARVSSFVAASLWLSVSAWAVSIDWVTVGDPGNGCDTSTLDCFGAVDYVYRIGKFEVTSAQYAEFLNAKAASDPLELYTTGMPGITRSGTSGSYSYSTIAGRESWPVTAVSYFDTLRFANWLHNGQGNGDTETGAYTLLGGTPIPSNPNVERNPGATVFLPTGDEWFKAAYYDTASRTYFDYPAGTDTQTVCSVPTALANRANCGGAVGTFTIVGSYPGSPSPNGTFDQGANATEWVDAIIFTIEEERALRGGNILQQADRLHAAIQEYDVPSFESGFVGFRVASLADGGGADCGDGSCDGAEDPQSCPADCPCATDGECDDGQFCNGVETCSGGACAGGAPIDCDDGVSCTNDACNEGADTCVHSTDHAVCDNGLFCDGAETCDPLLDCQDGVAPCQGGTCDEPMDACVSSAPELWIAFKTATAVPGLGTVQDEDIVVRDTASGSWSLRFDGSDVGLSGLTIDGLAVLPDGDLLLSFTNNSTVPGLLGGPSGNIVYRNDIVRFSPSSLGPATGGTFTFHFDGSDVGLTTSSENVDGIALTQDGKLIISTLGIISGSGASGNGEDLFVFNASSLGASTAGNFTMLFDGSDVGLSTQENVDAVGRTQAGELLLSTAFMFTVPGLGGADEDVIKFVPLQLGTTTSGSYSMFLDLTTAGISTAANLGAVELVE
jgi:formylglycine-generating enzyme required for sulfatase activity